MCAAQEDFIREREEKIYYALKEFLKKEINAGDYEVTFSETEGIKIIPSKKDEDSFKTLEGKLKGRGFGFTRVELDYVWVTK